METESRHRRRAIGAVLSTLACAIAVAAGAEPAIDQEQGDPANGTRIVGNERDLAQTFTAGVSGVLTRVDLKISLPTTAPIPYDLVVDLRPTTELGLPTEDDGIVLDRVVVPADTFPTFLQPIDFTGIEGLAVPVEASETLAIVLRSPTSPQDTAPYDWRSGPFGDSYAGGTAACRGDAIPLCASGWASLGSDQQFRTWVDPALRVDASIGDPGNGLRIVGNGRELAQTFTIETTGILRWIDLQVQQPVSLVQPYDLVVDVRPTAGGAPVEDDGAALATRTLTSADVPTFLEPRQATRVDELNLPVTAGDVLAVVLRSPSAPENTAPYDWFAGPFGDPYAGGSLFCRGSALTQCAGGWAALGGDVQMKTVIEVPEPGRGALAVAAIAALRAVARRYPRASK